MPAPDGVLTSGIDGYQRERPKTETPPAWPAKKRANKDIIAQDYAPIATNDLVTGDQVWGVPLNMDTLALFYDRSQINIPPKTWNEVAELTRRFTLRSGNAIARSTIALGDTASVNHAIDILSTLMLQNGTKMVDTARKTATFNISATGAIPPGTNALTYYTSFGQPNKDTYTWTRSLGSSLSSLKDGKTLMALGYLSDLSKVGPVGQTRIGVAPLPQVDTTKPLTYGRYLAATVTKQTAEPKRAKAAWQFVSLLANPDVAEQYATTLRLPAARIDVAKRLTLGPQYATFLNQVAIGTNWPKSEVQAADAAMRDALTLAVDKSENPQKALDLASKEYTTFLQRKTGIETDKNILSLWQRSDDTVDYVSLVSDYFSNNKTDLQRIVVSKHDPDRYEWELLNALAGRQGPDVLSLSHDAVSRYAPILRAFPKDSFNTIKKGVSEADSVRRTYIPAVGTDVLIDGQVYAMPVHVESLVLAYNRELWRKIINLRSAAKDALYRENRALLSKGPMLWDDLKVIAQVLTERSGTTVSLPALAMGTGSNVAHAEDLFAVLVRQYGGQITDPDRLVTGIHLPESVSSSKVAGQEALTLIKSFADPKSLYYTWNKTFPNSIEALADEKVIAAFIYPRDERQIRARNPEIDLGYFPLPQLSETATPIDSASYFVLAIPRNGKRPNDALGFIRASVASTSSRLTSPKKRGIAPVLDRLNGNAKSATVHSAVSYYKGHYPQEVDQAFIELIDGSVTLDQAASRVNQALKKKVFE